MSIRDLHTKEIKVIIAGGAYKVLPANFLVRSKIVHYFEDLLAGQIEGKLDWIRFSKEILSKNYPEIISH